MADEYVSMPGKVVKSVKTRYVFLGQGDPAPFELDDDGLVRGGQGRSSESLRDAAWVFVVLFIGGVVGVVAGEFLKAYLKGF